MKDLYLKIRKIKGEISELQRQKRSLSTLIESKKDRLKSLEELTINQISMEDINGF